MNIDQAKTYHATLTAVKCTYRLRFDTQGLQLFFYIHELDATTSRTMSLPKTLRPTSTTYTDCLGPIMVKTYDDELLLKPNLLAKALENDLAGKVYGVRLAPTGKEKYPIDIIEVLSLPRVDTEGGG